MQTPIYKPYLKGNEKKYVNDCLESSWISSKGKYIDEFEAGFRKLTGMKHAISVSNGSVALHLALHCLGIGVGDEVLVPSFTYIASVNSILLCGAIPVFVESHPDNWLIDLADASSKVTEKTKAIMPVHLYGFACDMESLSTFSRKHNLRIIEDAAEAAGVRVNSEHVGHFADATTFSFFGNKTITCGEGGMIVTNDDELAKKMSIAKNQGMSPTRRYWHDQFGVNYRMTNIQAAIGLAQLEQLEIIGREKKRVYNRYRDNLAHLNLAWQIQTEGVLESNYWLVSTLFSCDSVRNQVANTLTASGIETRPVFICAHKMPYLNCSNVSLPIAEDISERGLSLPSYPELSDKEIDQICEVITSVVSDSA